MFDERLSLFTDEELVDEFNRRIKHNPKLLNNLQFSHDILEVKTSAGIIKAEKSCDPGQPGIAVVLNPAGFDEEIDISFVSVYEEPEYTTSDNERPVDVCIMTYADVFNENYTSKDMIRREDVLAAL